VAPRKPARAFVRPAAKRSGGAAPPARSRPIESRILQLQGQAGNHAVSAQLAPAATTQRPKAYGQGVAEMLATEAPVLLGLLPAAGIAELQAQVDAKANNDAIGLEWNRTRRRINAELDLEQLDATQVRPEVFAKLQSEMMEVPRTIGKTFSIDAQAVLDVDGIRTSPGANSLDRSFREKIYAELTATPLVVEISPLRNGPNVGQLGPTYSSNRYGVYHTKGIVRFDDLVRLNGRYHEQYVAEVTANPALTQLREALSQLAIQVGQIRNDHYERSALNAKHGIIRRISESLGGASMSDYMELLQEAQKHPERGSLEEQMQALEAPYPSVKIWEAPEKQLAEANAFLQKGDFDLALLSFMQASNTSQGAAQQYQRYEEKVMKGAGIAVKWLERLKTAGKLAAGVASGGLALEAQAAAAAGYAILQEGGQQVSEVAYGQRSTVDLAGLARTAVTEGAMAYFSGLTQGAFTNALSERFETQLAKTWGPTLAKKAISATGAATSAFYTVPANTVLNRILSGTAMPQSMDELTKMVLDETLQNGGMDVALGFLHAHPAAAGEGEHLGEAGAPREGITPPREGLAAAGEHAAEPIGGGATGAPQSVASGSTPQAPAGDPHFLELVAHAGSEPTARDALIDHFGSWEDTIAALKTGTGELAPIAQAAREAMIHTLVAHRAALVGELATRFGAEQAKTASNEPGSDVDVNMTGADAGLHSAEAMTFLDANHPGWRKRFRMDIMVDAGRSRTLAGELAKLPAHERDAIARRQAEATEAFLLGREARNAPTPEERAEILGRIPNAELRERARTLAELDPAAAHTEHLRLLAHSDRAIAAIDPQGTTADRAAQVGEALDTQALANAFDPEAYVSTSTIRSVVLGEKVDVIGRYEGVIEQLDMLAHQAHEAGGMRGALRRYETYKYVQRICDQLTGAGIKDPRIAFLRNQGEMVYKMDRGAMGSSDPRTVSPRDVTGKSNMAYEEYGEVPGVSDAFLTDVHDMLQGLVDDHLPLLRKQAMGPAGDAAAGAALPQPMRVPELGPAEPPGAGPGPAGGGGPQAAAAQPGAANPIDRTGLRAPEAVTRVADAIAERGAPPATTTLHQYAAELLAPITNELAAIGTRPPTHVTVDLKNPSSWGYFDATTNQVVINEGALIDGKPAFDLTDPAGRQRVATLLFHESRHAEQYFRAMQYAASGAAPAGVVIPPPTGIHPDIVAAAHAHPIAHGSPEFEAGRLAYDEFYGQNHPWMQYGQDAQRTQFLRNEIDRLQTSRELAEEQLKNVRWWQLGSTAAIKGRIAGLQNQLIQLHGELNHRMDVYFALFHEHDAYGAQHDLERELPAARLRTAEHGLHDALEQLDAVRRLLPAEEARGLAEAGAALQHYWDSLESMGRSLRSGGGAAAVPAGQAATP
jgi:hypothetical protein